MSAIVIVGLIVIIILITEYFNEKLKKKDEEISNLMSNIVILRNRNQECDNLLDVIEYTNKIKQMSNK